MQTTRVSEIDGVSLRGILGSYFWCPNSFMAPTLDNFRHHSGESIICNHLVAAGNLLVIMSRKSMKLDDFVTGKNSIGTSIGTVIFHKLAVAASATLGGQNNNASLTYGLAKEALLAVGKVEGFEALDVNTGKLIWISLYGIEAFIQNGTLQFQAD